MQIRNGFSDAYAKYINIRQVNNCFWVILFSIKQKVEENFLQCRYTGIYVICPSQQIKQYIHMWQCERLVDKLFYWLRRHIAC